MGTSEPASTAVRRATTDELTAAEVIEIRGLLAVAFGDDEDERFTDEDWAHAVGGVHVLVEDGGAIVAHGSVVERAIEIDGRPIRTGYVEAVATRPDRQGQGLGTRLMTEIAEVIG